MTTDTAWLAALRPGDEVVIDHGRYGTNDYHICKIDKITPTGRIVIGDRTFNSDGWERGGSAYHTLRLQEATPTLRAQIAEIRMRNSILKDIRATRFDKLSTDALLQIAAILDGARE